MTKKYAIELSNEDDIVIEIPDDAYVSMRPVDSGLSWSIEVLRLVGGDDMFGPTNTLAFYKGVQAVRCLDEVKREDLPLA